MDDLGLDGAAPALPYFLPDQALAMPEPSIRTLAPDGIHFFVPRLMAD